MDEKQIGSISVTRSLLAAKKMTPNKKLGQNFLVDGEVLQKIAAAVNPQKGELIIEIGAGLGALSQVLAQSGAPLLLLEIDAGAAAHLSEYFKDKPNIKVVCADALSFDFAAAQAAYAYTACKLVSNLPYHLTSQLTERLLRVADWSQLVLMMQKEAAERLLAQPDQRGYGPLSLEIAYRGEAELLFKVASGSFYPPPAVTSAVIRISKRAYPLKIADEKLLFSLIKAAFALKRKTLFNSLSANFKMDKKQLQAALQQAGLDGRRRAENLALPEFIALSEAVLAGQQQ